MTTLLMPSIDRRLLQVVIEEATAETVREWSPRSLELCLDLIRNVREHTIKMRQQIEDLLADGVETTTFARSAGPLLNMIDLQIAEIQKSVTRLSPAEDSASVRLATELRLVEVEMQSVRDLLAKALLVASKAPRPSDQERVRAAEEAYSRGETKPFAKK